MLRGRAHESAEIGRLVGGLHDGRPFVLTVTGEPGSGRSSLLAEARDHAATAGVAVLAARGTDTVGRAQPYDGLATLLRPLRHDGDDRATTLIDSLSGRAPLEALALRSELLAVLTVAAGACPTMVLLDDADRLDPSSVEALSFCFGRLGVDPLGVIASAGGTDPFGEVATHRVSLTPLSVDAISALLSADRGCAPAVAHTVATWAAGNPLVAVELARSLSSGERDGTMPLPTRPPSGVRMVEQLQRELDGLGDEVRQALAVAAADRTGSVGVIQRALLTLGAAVDGLAGAEDADVITIDRDRLTFRHPLLRLLAAHLVAGRSRRAAHRALAMAFSRPDQAGERVWQLESSCAGPDEEVAAALELVAADHARRSAWPEAVAAYERAAELSLAPDERRRRLGAGARCAFDGLALDDAVRLAEEAAADGHTEAALTLVDAVERRDGPHDALRMTRQVDLPSSVIADLLVATGRLDDARTELKGADDDTLVDVLRWTLDPRRHRPAEPEPGRPLADRARRRWLATSAAGGHAPARPTGLDELLAAAVAARVAGRSADAAAIAAQARAMVPAGCVVLLTAIDEIIAAAEEDRADPTLDALTPAERRVADAVAAGRTNKEAAAELFLSVKTVDFHLQGIYRKLNVRSRTELAVRLAGRGGGS